MSGKKDQAVAVIVNDMTTAQAANFKAAVMKDKQKIAPQARAVAFSGNKSDIKNHLSGTI